MTDHIPRIVLTGGPCAGKSTGLSILMQKLPEFGITPFLVPEVATLVLTSGVHIQDIVGDHALNAAFQKEIARTQLGIEDAWKRFACIQPGSKKALVCDRGFRDGRAYIDAAVFDNIVSGLGYDPRTIGDERYTAVIHLVTAADGAPEFYNLDNPARYEKTLEAAMARDTATLSAWMGHPHLRIIGNTKIIIGVEEKITFDEKMERLVAEVCHALDIPAPLQIARRFLVTLDMHDVATPRTTITIEQTYLNSGDSGAERRVRARMYGVDSKSTLYTYTEKKKIGPGTWYKTERIISSREYAALLEDRDTRLVTIKKRRHSFAYRSQYFHLDEFIVPADLTILEIELTEENTEFIVPPFIRAQKDVTDEEGYSNAQIAAGRTTS